MDCPVCKNEPMIVLELNEVEIDYCLSCKGIWLDAGELELLLGSSTETVEFLNSFTSDDITKEKTHKCPICNKKMEKILVIGNRKVRIDKCKYNHGIWFDSGELEDILGMRKLDNKNKVLTLLNDMLGKKIKE
ncbi:MAG: zf-TFIIB domain-containing protein [Candidatus Cloacimonetes bacterium]|nr:zf-TFIIB domain-containing protein [Candidatus Cloacimonadota bacterium]